jgi:hypothetical protein
LVYIFVSLHQPMQVPDRKKLLSLNNYWTRARVLSNIQYYGLVQ